MGLEFQSLLSRPPISLFHCDRRQQWVDGTALFGVLNNDVADTAAAIRYIGLTDVAAAIIVSRIGLGSYGRILTVLTCPSLVDEVYMDEDGDSDEALEESWILYQRHLS